MNFRSKNAGFTLIEIAIVLLIVTIILGYTVALFPKQEELKQYRQAEAEMDKIIGALYAFAQTNNYLPCPAWADDLVTPTNTSNGFECRDIDATAGNCDGDDPLLHSCDVWFGFLPGKALGLDGKYSDIGLMLDPWGQPYRYQVSYVDAAGGASIGEDFVFSGDMQNEGISNLNPDLTICNQDPSSGSAGINDDECTNANETIFGAAITTNPCSDPNINCSPAVLLSTGKDKQGNVAANSWVQRENLDNSINDTVFIKTTFNDASGSEFDDLVKWISPNILYSKMIEAGQLP